MCNMSDAVFLCGLIGFFLLICIGGVAFLANEMLGEELGSPGFWMLGITSIIIPIVTVITLWVLLVAPGPNGVRAIDILRAWKHGCSGSASSESKASMDEAAHGDAVSRAGDENNDLQDTVRRIKNHLHALKYLVDQIENDKKS